MPRYLFRLLSTLGLMWAFAYEDDPGGGGGTTPDPDPDPDDDADLGEKGEKALKAERDARKSAEKARKAADKELSDLKAKLAELEEGTKADHEKELEKVRSETKAEADKEATAKVRERIVRSEVKAAAAGKLADPADAIRLLDLDEFDVDDDGDVDDKAIEKAIAQLLKEKPYLAAEPKPKGGSGDNGARGSRDDAGVTPGIGRLRSAYSSSNK